MKKAVSLFLMVCLASMPLLGMAQAEQAQAEKPAAVEVGNKLCPVSGEKVGEMGEPLKYEYNGKIYNFCCAMCLKDFQKDPEKFSKIAEDEVAAAAKAGS